MNEVQLLADAIGNAPPVPSAGGECRISEIDPGVGSRTVKVTGLGGSPDSIPVTHWSQGFDDRITLYGFRLVGRRVFVLVTDRQPFIVDLAVGG